jgi:DNA gyrase subunit A
VVGDVMGRLHPHGDSAIYDALVRMAQPWAMRLPLIDGHGNFGSLGGDDSAAAYRYTEARLDAAAMELVTSIDEDTVDFQPNYDGQDAEPQVLPAAFPNLLVNGAAGIAVGMATNMAPHNLGEVIAAARHLIAHPDADLDTLMRFVPGPDLPTGGKIVGLEGIRDAYETGRGIFRTRAAARIEKITPRRTGIVVTELPYGVGPEKVATRIKDLVQTKKLAGIADLKDLTDRHRGLHLVIEVRSGFHPEAVLAELYRLTPMEETFGINNVALVDGQPRVLGLRELLEIFVAHRLDVVRRRTEYRRRKRSERLHLVDGLLVALLNIDEVIGVIRSSDNAASAKTRLMDVFELSEIQAQYILDTPLRRLTRYDRLELEREQDELRAEIASLTAILESDDLLREVVAGELAEVAKRFGTPRRTVLLESGSEAAAVAAVPLEVADDPCVVLMSGTGLVARAALSGDDSERVLVPPPAEASRTAHDVIVAAARATVRGTVGLVTSAGRLIKLNVLELPAMPPGAGAVSLAGGTPVTEFASFDRGETVVGLAAVDSLAGGSGLGLALGTAEGVVKRVLPDYPQNRDEFDRAYRARRSGQIFSESRRGHRHRAWWSSTREHRNDTHRSWGVRRTASTAPSPSS